MLFNKDLAIIITASYIPSHPDIRIIREVIESLELINYPPDTLIILAHDWDSNPDYYEYFKNLTEFIKDKRNFKIVFRKKHGHLTGNIRNALEHVKSEFVLVLQHDLKFNKRKFDIMKIIQDMKLHPELKHIRFNKRSNRATNCDSYYNLFGKEIKCNNYTYTRTNAWSDNNHICPTNYYRDFVMKVCKDGRPMEKYLLLKTKNEKDHLITGTYLFGPVEDKSYIKHLDGRNSK